MVVAFDRDRFATARVLPIRYGYHDDTRLRATAARNPKRLFEWPDFFVCVDDKKSGTHKLAIMETD
jgi:hypothetical protein